MHSRLTTVTATLLIALATVLFWPSAAPADTSDKQIYVLTDDIQSDGEDLPDLNHCARAYRIDDILPVTLTPLTPSPGGPTQACAAAHAIRAPPGLYRYC